MRSLLHIVEENRRFEPNGRIAYYLAAKDKKSLEASNILLISFHGLVNRDLREFPFNNARSFKKNLPDDWCCLSVLDPLLFDDKELRGSFFIGSDSKLYVDLLVEEITNVKQSLDKEFVYVVGGSASSLIASVIASRLKTTAICMSPILLLKNYLKHIVRDLCDRHWHSDFENLWEYNESLLKKECDFKRLYLLCNSSDYNHNIMQSFTYYREAMEQADKNRSVHFLESELSKTISLQVTDWGKSGHFVPGIDVISSFLTEVALRDNEVHNFSADISPRSAAKDVYRPAINTDLKSLTDSIW